MAKYRVSSLLALLLLMIGASALAEGFTTDYAAIDTAAKSVLLLEIYDEYGDNIASGSGFCAFDRHTLVTNYHVIEGADSILAYTDDGDAFYIESVYAAQEDRDLALLKMHAPDSVVPLPVADTSQLLRAQPVLAIGSPEGYHNTVSTGNISALRTDEGFREIQFTAPISSGSSGGALFNNAGEVIGVTYASVDEGQNLNYAIDIAYAQALYQSASSENAVSFADWWAGAHSGNPLLSVYDSDVLPVSAPEWSGVYREGTDTCLNWEAVEGADSYRIYYCESEIGIYLHLATLENETSYRDAQAPETRYYKLRAVNGNELSPFSAAIAFTEE